MMATTIHMAAHLLVPALAAWLFFRPRWCLAWLIMLATMAVDLDHLLADPVFRPAALRHRFSPAAQLPGDRALCRGAGVQAAAYRGAGLLIHMLVDGADCLRLSL